MVVIKMQELLEMIAYGQMIDEMFLEIRNEIIDRRVINYLKVKYLLLFRKGFVIINNDKLDKTTKGIVAYNEYKKSFLRERLS